MIGPARGPQALIPRAGRVIGTNREKNHNAGSRCKTSKNGSRLSTLTNGFSLLAVPARIQPAQLKNQDCEVARWPISSWDWNRIAEGSSTRTDRENLVYLLGELSRGYPACSWRPRIPTIQNCSSSYFCSSVGAEEFCSFCDSSSSASASFALPCLR